MSTRRVTEALWKSGLLCHLTSALSTRVRLLLASLGSYLTSLELMARAELPHSSVNMGLKNVQEQAECNFEGKARPTQQHTTLGSSLWRTMLPGRPLLASCCGCLRPARWPLMVLISLEGEL